MATERVVIIVDWSQAEASDDAERFVRDAALRELQMGKGYRRMELEEVGRDATFAESCRRTAIRMHNRETDRKRRVLAGRQGVPEKLVEKTTVVYTRPVSRGMWDRERAEMRE